MDSIIDVVGREKIESREVILYMEGIFYKAYGYSALRFIRNIRPYQVKKRYYKNIDAEVCYLGFPQAALDGLLAEGFQAEKEEDKVIIRGPFGTLVQQEYDEWVRSIPLSVSRPRSNDSARREGPVYDGMPADKYEMLPSQEREVLHRIHGFALEAATPLECMLFLSELKKILNG